MKKNGDELRAALKELGLDVPDEAVEELRKSYGAEDDEAFDFEAVDAIAEELRKSMETGPELEDLYLDDDAFDLDVDDDGEYIDVAASLERFAKSADLLTTRQEAQSEHVGKQLETLQKAWLAELQLNEQLVKGHGELVKLVKSQGEQLASILQQLGVPIPPRSVTSGVEAEPSPGEKQQEQMAKGGKLFDEVLQKAHSVMQDTATTEQRRGELLRAVSVLESGCDPSKVAADFSIAIGG